MSSKLRKFAEVALVLFGLLGSLGVMFGGRDMRIFAQATLASPILVVYTEQSEDRLMSLKPIVELEMVDGERKSFVFSRELYEQIASHENPFNRHLLTLPYFASIMLYTDVERDREIRVQVLRYGFCQNGPFAEYLSLEKSVRSLRVLLGIAGEPDGREVLRMSC